MRLPWLVCGSDGWTSSCKPKGHRFNSRSGHIPRLQIWSPVRVRTKGNQSMFLSHINVSLLLSLPPFPSVLEGKKKKLVGVIAIVTTCCMDCSHCSYHSPGGLAYLERRAGKETGVNSRHIPSQYFHQNHGCRKKKSRRKHTPIPTGLPLDDVNMGEFPSFTWLWIFQISLNERV